MTWRRTGVPCGPVGSSRP